MPLIFYELEATIGKKRTIQSQIKIALTIKYKSKVLDVHIYHKIHPNIVEFISLEEVKKS